MERARIPAFRAVDLPVYATTSDPNDNIRLSSYRPIRLFWGGEHRRGINLRIEDAYSKIDHIVKAIDREFFLAADIPLPPEIQPSLDTLCPQHAELLKRFRVEQIRFLRTLV